MLLAGVKEQIINTQLKKEEFNEHGCFTERLWKQEHTAQPHSLHPGCLAQGTEAGCNTPCKQLNCACSGCSSQCNSAKAAFEVGLYSLSCFLFSSVFRLFLLFKPH